MIVQLLHVVVPGSHVHLASAAFCNGAPDPAAKANTNPIWTEPPRHVRSVENASLYVVGNGEDAISLVHLFADNAYDRGLAHGKLMKEDASTFYKEAFAFFQAQFVQAVNKTVPWIP